MSSSDLIRWGALAAMVGGALWISLCPIRSRRGEPGSKRSSGCLYYRRVAPASGRAGWLPHPTERKPRAHRTGGLLYVHSGGSCSSPGLVARLGRKLDAWRGSNQRRGFWHIGRAGAVWCSYFASQGTATLVRHSTHCILAPHDTLTELRGIVFGAVWLALGYVLWSRRGAATEQPSGVS
jgi:hypothetical protein